MVKSALFQGFSDIDFRLLRVFHAVVSCGGVSAAELELNIGKSTISRHLTDLEIRLGSKLCHRGAGGFALTDEGRRIHSATLQLFSAVRVFQAEADETGKELTGPLSIAFFDKVATNPNARLPQAVRAFHEIAPRVEIEVHVEPVDSVETGVLNGRFQIGIVPTHRHSANMDYYDLYHENMNLYCGKHHPLFAMHDEDITLEILQEQKFAGFSFHSLNMMASHKWKFSRHAIVNNEEGLAMLVLSGCYVGYLPDHITTQAMEAGEMRAIRPDVYNYRSDHSAIVRRTPRAQRRVEKFLECLRDAHRT